MLVKVYPSPLFLSLTPPCAICNHRILGNVLIFSLFSSHWKTKPREEKNETRTWEWKPHLSEKNFINHFPLFWKDAIYMYWKRDLSLLESHNLIFSWPYHSLTQALDMRTKIYGWIQPCSWDFLDQWLMFGSGCTVYILHYGMSTIFWSPEQCFTITAALGMIALKGVASCN